MKLKVAIITLIFIALLTPALAQSTATITVNDNIFTSAPPVVGQKIKLMITVSTASNSPVPIEGFWVAVYFKKPNNQLTGAEWFDFRQETIPIGQSKSYYLQTSTVADLTGQWTAYVRLTTSDRSITIDTASATFYVGSSKTTPTPEPSPTPTQPIGSIEINQALGYVTGIAGVLAAAMYFIPSLRPRW